MKKIKETIILLAALAAVGCGGINQNQTNTSAEKAKTVIGFSQLGAESDWRIANTESIKSTFTEDNGYTLIYDEARQKQENQIKAIRNFILQDVDYIVLEPVTETGWDTVLKEAKAANIPVIVADRMIDVEDESLYAAWIGSDFYKEGKRAGEWLEEYLKENNKDGEDINIVTLQGTIGSTAQIGRTNGFGEIAESHPNWHILDKKPGDFTQAKGREVMEEYIKAYPDIDVVVSENDNMSFGAIQAIKEAGKTCGADGDITIISFDGLNAALKKMAEGDINVCIECNPLHGPGVKSIIEKLEKKQRLVKIQYVEEGIFTREYALSKINEIN